MFVEMGNDSAKEAYRASPESDELSYRPLKGLRVSRAVFSAGESLAEAFVTITSPGRGFWDNHSTGKPPVWVASDNASLQQLLADHYGCDAGYPKNLEETHHTYSGPPGVGPGISTKKKGASK